MARDYASVVAEVGARLRLDTSIASILAMVQGWVNDVIEDVHSRHDWFWTLDRQIVQTVIDKTDGTVSIAAAGTTITGVGTGFSSGDVGKFIQFEGSNDWYKITAVASELSATIEIGYNGTSSLSSGTYIIRKIFYSIPGAEKILGVKQAQIPGELICINYKDFDSYLTFGDTTGKANRFAVYGYDGSNNLQINIYPHADVAYNLEIRHKKKATEDSIALTPEKWRGVYIEGALARGLEYVALGQSEFPRAAIDQKKSDYERFIARMRADAEPESDYHPVMRNNDVSNSLPTPRLPDGLSIPLD